MQTSLLERIVEARWRYRVFDLHPILGSTRAIRQAKSFRHDAEPASLAKDNASKRELVYG